MKKIVLAIDVMGGDFGPKTTIEGIAMASKIHPNVKFKLFGDKKKSNDDLVRNLSLTARPTNFLDYGTELFFCSKLA